GDAAHGLVHGCVVVCGRDDEVGVLDEVVVADAVVVQQGATRRFDDADGFAQRGAGGHQVGAGDVGVIEQAGDALGAVQGVDHAGPVLGQRGGDGLATAPGDELGAGGFGAWGVEVGGVVDAGQGADAVPAVLKTEHTQ